MSSSSEPENLKRISEAIDYHNASCEWPAVAIAMNPFEVERLGWDSIRGLPIRSDPNLGTGRFRVICGRDEVDEQEEQTVEAVSTEYLTVGGDN